jgi:hypothetical protein
MQCSVCPRSHAGAHAIFDPSEERSVFKAPRLDNVKRHPQVSVGGPQPQDCVFVGYFFHGHCLDVFNVHSRVGNAFPFL